MNFPAGTSFTITDGADVWNVLIIEQEHTIEGKTMLGTWGLHRSSTGNLLFDHRGSWYLTRIPLSGLGDCLLLCNQRGKPLLMINTGGSAQHQGCGFFFNAAGKKGARVKGYSNIPLPAFDRIWFGFGMKWGGQLGPFGAELTIAALINVGTRETTIVQLQGLKAGLGLGGSASLTAILAFNYKKAQDLNGATNDGFDFALSFGEKWDGILKNLENTPKYAGWLGKLPDECRYFEEAQVVAARLKKVENLANWAKILASFSNAPTADSTFVAFDIPGGGTGLEVGVSYGVTTIISVDGIDAPSASVGRIPKLPGRNKVDTSREPRSPSGLGRRDW